MKKHTKTQASVQLKLELDNGQPRILTDEEREKISQQIAAAGAARAERRRMLADVFNDTKKFCKERHYNKVTAFRISGPITETYEYAIPEVKVIDMDCIEVAKQLSKEGKTCMLNMANATDRGGGVERGAMAQEEELCRRSNLWYGLKKSFYPMGDVDFSYQKNIKFFKDGKYEFYNDPFKCDIITIAAPCLIGYKPGKFPPFYSYRFELKVQQALWYPAQMGAKNLVLSALGCGAFRNNPLFVSRLFKKHLKNLPYEKVYFAILDDHNAKANGISNYQTFKNTFRV